MRIENWCGYNIRFVEIDGHWYAILKDICDALHLRTAKIAERLDPSMLERVRIPSKAVIPSKYSIEHQAVKTVNSAMIGKDIGKRKDEVPLKDVDFNTYDKTYWMLAVNEKGIYQALFASRKLEARKFQMWTFDVLEKLRRGVGLEEYEVMRMTEPDIQAEIDYMLDGLFYDEESGKIMMSVTVEGGDVDQVPLE